MFQNWLIPDVLIRDVLTGSWPKFSDKLLLTFPQDNPSRCMLPV